MTIFFERLRLGIELDREVDTYFLPKLTEEEMELVETKDSSYLQTFFLPNPDRTENEMNFSGADSKYVQGWCGRKTYTIENTQSSEEENLNCCYLQ